MELIKIYENRFRELIKTKVQCVYLETTTQLEETPLKTETNIEILNNLGTATVLSCSFCKTEFSDVSKQREHYKLDWHRYNLKRSLSGRDPLTEDQFTERNGKSNLNSLFSFHLFIFYFIILHFKKILLSSKNCNG